MWNPMGSPMWNPMAYQFPPACATRSTAEGEHDNMAAAGAKRVHLPNNGPSPIMHLDTFAVTACHA